MAAIYPDEWTFVCDDVFEYARRRYAEGRTYDLVSLDPPTNLFERCADLDRPLVLARPAPDRRSAPAASTALGAPEGWRIDLRHPFRSAFRGGTYWTTLEPA